MKIGKKSSNIISLLRRYMFWGGGRTRTLPVAAATTNMFCNELKKVR